MPLVEVVSADGGDPEVALRAAAFIRQIDRLPLLVKSAPGFLVNAVLGPYMLEAMRVVDEGLSPETVDEAMLAFGMPMGPIALVDMVGLDVAMAAGRGWRVLASSRLKCLVERFNTGCLSEVRQGFLRLQYRKAGEACCRYRARRSCRAIDRSAA